MSATLKHKIISGVFWQGLEKFGTQGISFLISVILAWLLAPKDFGVLSIMMIFSALCGCFVESGFGTVWIQKKDANKIDCSSVFFLNILVAVVAYFTVFLAAPWIGVFFKNDSLPLLLRVFALVVIIRSFSLVQVILLSKWMLFKLCFKINWTTLWVSGAIGVTLAYRNFGSWALVVQQLTNTIVSGILLCFFVKWRLVMKFQIGRIKDLFQFGGKILCSNFLDSLYNDAYPIVIGKLFHLNVLAFFNRGQSIPNLAMNLINSTMGAVSLPALAELGNKNRSVVALKN